MPRNISLEGECRDKRPCLKGACDVLVVGATRVAAAHTAARQGLCVVLLERYGYCGGGAVAGFPGTVCGMYHATDRAGAAPRVVFGFLQTFMNAMRSRGGITPPRYGKTFTHVHDPLMWREVADALVQQAGVDVLFHTTVTEVLVEGGERVAGVVAYTKEGPMEVRAKVDERRERRCRPHGHGWLRRHPRRPGQGPGPHDDLSSWRCGRRRLAGSLRHATFVVANADSMWQMLEVRNGWLPPWGIEPVMRRRGEIAGRHVLWGIDRLDGQQAHDLRLVDIGISARRIARARSLASSHAPLPPSAARSVKAYQRSTERTHTRTADALASGSFQEHCGTDAARLTLAKFVKGK